jgi:hypothetical protein
MKMATSSDKYSPFANELVAIWEENGFCLSRDAINKEVAKWNETVEWALAQSSPGALVSVISIDLSNFIENKAVSL